MFRSRREAKLDAFHWLLIVLILVSIALGYWFGLRKARGTCKYLVKSRDEYCEKYADERKRRKDYETLYGTAIEERNDFKQKWTHSASSADGWRERYVKLATTIQDAAETTKVV